MVPSTVIYNEYLQKVRRYLRHHEMVLGGEHVLLAVSGGVDSIALLDMMARIAPELKLQLGVAHFDHGLRGDAAHRDASFVVEQAKLRGIKTYVGRGDVKKLAGEYKLSIEEAGRKARYAFFKRVAQKHRYSVVMTGHNANDNAETLLMNLLRGSGVKGLAAIPPVRSLMRGVVLARPLLEFERDLIEAYAKEMDIEWSEDETNRSPQFLRNRIRAELLPLMKQFNPSIVGTLASTANIMQCLEQYISQTVEHAIERVVTDRTKESLALKLNQLKHYLPAMQTEIVQRSVSDVFEIPPISYGAIERTLGLMWKESGSKAEIGNGITALRDRETLEVRRELPPPPPVVRTFRAGETVQVGRTVLRTTMVERDVAQPGTISTIEFVDASKITGELTLRTWREGDRFRPFGMDGEKKLSDFLIDKKVPLDKKGRILVVTNGPEIVWVCGMRLDDRYRITPETEKVLRMELEVAADPTQRPSQGRQQQGRGTGGARPTPGRPQSPLQGPERGGDGRREDRRGERRDDERRDDERRDAPAARQEDRPRERREGDRREGDRREGDRREGDRRPDDRRSGNRRQDDRRPEDRRPDDRRSAEGENDRRRDQQPEWERPADEQARRDRPREGGGGEDRGGRDRQREPRRDEPGRDDSRRNEPRRGEGRRDERSERREPEEGERRERAPLPEEDRADRREPRRDDRPERKEERDERAPEQGEPRRDDRRSDSRRRDDRRRDDRRRDDRPADEQRRPEGADERTRGEDRAADEPRDRNERRDPRDEPQRSDAPPAGEPAPTTPPVVESRSGARIAPRREPPKRRDEPDWGEELPHGFGDEEYDRGAAPEPRASTPPEKEAPAPRQREPRAPRRERPAREPRVVPDVIQEGALPDDRPAPAAEQTGSAAGAEEGATAKKRPARPSRGGRGRGAGKGRGAAGPEGAPSAGPDTE